MKKNEARKWKCDLLLAAAALISAALLLGTYVRLQAAERMIGAQRSRIEELEARPLTVELVCEAAEESAAADKPAWHDAGEFRIYHYCPCAYCCGKSDGITATGTLAAEGRTVAVDPDVIPLGSEVMINGVIYIAEDTGVTGKSIDLFVDSHAQAVAMGTYTTDVKWRESNG